MEDSEYEYNTLKASLSNVPVKFLNEPCRKILSKNLDIKHLLPSKSGCPRDFRGLAELIGFQYADSRKFEKYHDPTTKILEAWETHPNATLGNLIDYLEKIQRLDVIKEIEPILRELAKKFQHLKEESTIPVQSFTEENVGTSLLNQKNQRISVPETKTTSSPMRQQNAETNSLNTLLTCEDLRTGERTLYDAYVCYADKDCEFVQDLARFLEEIGLKLFIRDRDMLAGSTELNTNIEMIKNRCRRMLIILSENFLHSSQCAFQISFATSLSIEQRERILVPILVSPCEVPSVLSILSRIDFTKAGIYEWMWERLILSLLPQKRVSGIKPPAQPYQAPSRAIGTSTRSPVITFPETVKLSSSPLLDLTSTDPVTVVSVGSESNPSEGESAEAKSDLGESTRAKVVLPRSENPVITVPETAQGLVCPVTEPSATAIKSSKTSSKPLQVVSEKVPVTRRIRNTLRSYFRKESPVSNSSSDSFLSNVTSGYQSESTF